MLDLHCHILPGIDDGAESINASLAMAEKAISQGITHILCTPHHNNGKYVNPKEFVIQQVTKLQAELDKRNLQLTLFEGQEVRITGDLLEEIEQHRILFTDEANTYLLIEFPTMDVPAYTEQLLFDLRAKGHVPIIVHPERNAKFRENPNRLIPFLEMGCLAQLTAPSYVGIFGKNIQKTARQMVEHRLVQMVASDAHGVHKRNFYLKEAFEAIEQDFGRDYVNQMEQVAKDVLNGDVTEIPLFSEIRKKKFGLF